MSYTSQIQTRNMLSGCKKRVEFKRHKAYENYYILYRFVVATFEPVFSPTFYQKFYIELQGKHKKMVLG